MKDRIDALVRGVQGGLYSPNDARNMEGLDAVPHGDEPRLQAQCVPLSAAGAIPTAPAAAASPAVPTETAAVKQYNLDLEGVTDTRQTSRAHCGAQRNGRAARTCRPESANERIAAMMFLKGGARNRLAFQFGRVSALRSTSDTVEQLQAQIERLQEQLRFNAAEYERQIAVLLRDLMQARYELAQRDLVEAFAAEPSPSAMVH